MKLLALLLTLIALANPSAELDALRRSGDAEAARVAEALDAGLAELTGESRPQQCMDAFLAGELYRKADALAPGLGYDEEALGRFRAMRVEFLDLTAGQLGYIGEARVYRQKGDPEEALKAIAPLMDARDDAKIRRLAQLEALESQLLIDPKRAIAESGELGDAAADWVRARAYAATGQADKALGYARSESAAAAAPAFDRLALIASLDGLTDDERAAWAQALTAAGRLDEALAVLDEDAPPGSEPLHARLLHQAGRLEEAVDAWRTAIDNGAGLSAELAYAACLEALAEESTGDEAVGIRKQAIGVYRSLAESDADEPLRRDALRRWFYLSGPDAVRDLIDSQSALISTDPYLRFARARVLKDALDPGELSAELRSVIAEAQDPSLRASAVLMAAQHEPDRRAALASLTDHWGLLMSRATTAEAAQRYRVALWVELGMIDVAAAQMLAAPGIPGDLGNPGDPGDAGAQPAESLLLVASALSQRYTDGVAGDAQPRVMRLAGAAIAQAPEDEGVALAAAELMLRVGARADAVRVLSSISNPDAAPVLAQALRGMGRLEEALGELEGNDTPAAAIERGLCLIELDRPDEALDEARAARGGVSAGGDTWWRATLVLARAHLAMDDAAAAADVLRVSEALYPLAGRVWLRNELETLKKELEG